MGEALTKERKSSACCRVGAMVATERRAWVIEIERLTVELCGEARRNKAAADIQRLRLGRRKKVDKPGGEHETQGNVTSEPDAGKRGRWAAGGSLLQPAVGQ